MKITIPAFLEVEPDAFKSSLECNYADVIKARAREKDTKRRRSLTALLRLNGKAWLEFPRMTIGDMTS
jgi:hypothetical protein